MIAPENFNDYELKHPREILENNGIEVIIASTVVGKCRGMNGSIIESKINVEDIDPDLFDSIIIVGGRGALTHLQDNEALIDLLKKFNKKGKLVSAIGRGRHLLHNAGLFGDNFSRGPEVEIDRNIIAARPPTTTPGWTSKKYGHLLVEHLIS